MIFRPWGGTGLELSDRAALASALLRQLGVMRGVITGKDVVRNVGIIWREFGSRCLVRLLWVLLIGRQTTFLEVISQT